MGDGLNLSGYIAKGAHDYGAPVDPSLATAAFVPVAVALIWIIIHDVRMRHLRYDKAPPARE